MESLVATGVASVTQAEPRQAPRSQNCPEAAPETCGIGQIEPVVQAEPRQALRLRVTELSRASSRDPEAGPEMWEL